MIAFCPRSADILSHSGCSTSRRRILDARAYESDPEERFAEIRVLRREVERLEGLIEERLLPMSKPLPDEVDAIKRYIRDKRTGRSEFERLEEL